MAKLFYGEDKGLGFCNIEGSDIRGIEIRYRGAIEIDKKTPDSFVILHQRNGIVIFPNVENFKNESLHSLFEYVGEFYITSVLISDSKAEKVPTTIHRVMDYTELLNTNAEDMTTKSEDLSATHVSGKKVSKTLLKQPNLNNQHTSTHNAGLYLEDGTLYNGSYHIHLSNNAAMTGKEHSEDSQDLYFNHGKPTKNPKLVPYGAIQQQKTRKKAKLKSRRSNRRKY